MKTRIALPSILCALLFPACTLDQGFATAEKVVGSTLANQALKKSYTQQTRDDLASFKTVLPDIVYPDKVSDFQCGEFARRLNRLFNDTENADSTTTETLNKIMNILTTARDAIPPTTAALLSGHFQQVAAGIQRGVDFNGGWHSLDAPQLPPEIKEAKARKASVHP